CRCWRSAPSGRYCRCCAAPSGPAGGGRARRDPPRPAAGHRAAAAPRRLAPGPRLVAAGPGGHRPHPPRPVVDAPPAPGPLPPRRPGRAGCAPRPGRSAGGDAAGADPPHRPGGKPRQPLAGAARLRPAGAPRRRGRRRSRPRARHRWRALGPAGRQPVPPGGRGRSPPRRDPRPPRRGLDPTPPEAVPVLTLAWPWLLTLLPLPWLYRLAARPARARGAALRSAHYARLTGQLATTGAPTHPWRHGLLALIWLALLLAAARPTWTGEPVTLPTSGRDLMLAVDISDSMRIADMAAGNEWLPRVTVVKAVVGDFVARREGDRL